MSSFVSEHGFEQVSGQSGGRKVEKGVEGGGGVESFPGEGRHNRWDVGGEGGAATVKQCREFFFFFGADVVKGEPNRFACSHASRHKKNFTRVFVQILSVNNRWVLCAAVLLLSRQD